MIFGTTSDGFAGKLVCLSEPPGILHRGSSEYWCQWTIWQVVALVDNDMPLTLSSLSLSTKMWQFQENDVYCEQLGANALLHRPFLRSQFSNFDRYWVFIFLYVLSKAKFLWFEANDSLFCSSSHLAFPWHSNHLMTYICVHATHCLSNASSV